MTIKSRFLKRLENIAQSSSYSNNILNSTINFPKSIEIRENNKI